MLKKLLSYAGTLSAALWMAGTVHAVTLTFEDIWDEGEILFSGSTPAGVNSYSYEHDILDHGFSPVLHTLTSVSLTIEVRDEVDPPDSPDERVKVFLDGDYYGLFEVEYTDLFFTVDLDLLADGMLEVLLTRDKGDFLFLKSKLVAEATGPEPVPPTPSPEPSTLILLGSGLAGVVGLGRRHRQKTVPA
jgi:hypothetical protein